MNQQATRDQIAVATDYQNILVPALFTAWPPRVADAAQIRSGQRVLDVACGTGILTREIFRRAGNNGDVYGLDLDPGMLSIAADLEPEITWQSGNAESLPYENQYFDAVTCHFGLMFFTDRVEAIREMLRVLKPGGNLAVIVWASLPDIPAYARLVSLIEHFANTSAADILRRPFCLGNSHELMALFHEAGVASIQLASQCGQAHFPSIQTMMDIELRTKSWMPFNQYVDDHLSATQEKQIREAAEQALAEYCDTQGTVTFNTAALTVTGNNTLNH